MLNLKHEQITTPSGNGRFFVQCICGWASGMSHPSKASADVAWMRAHLRKEGNTGERQ